MEEKNYLVSGMHCAGCAAKVERAVEGLEGVERVELNLLTGKMTVLFEKPDSPAMERIAPVVEKVGFRLADWKEEPLAGTEREERLEQEETGGSRLVWSILLLVPLMYLSMGPMWHWPVPGGSWGLWMNWWTQGILAGAVLWLNRHYLINGVRQLVALSPNMDSLIAIGSGSAFLYGLYLLVAGMWQGFSVEGMELYFESAAMIVTLISLGKYLERRSYRKTNAAVKGLVKLVPQEALVWHDGAERAVPLDEIRSGDLVVVKTGQRIPVDGMIEEGQAALDESDLTGESMPVDRAAGDRVISGTFNRAGYLKIRAERVGGDSTLAIGATLKVILENSSNSFQLKQGDNAIAYAIKKDGSALSTGSEVLTWTEGEAVPGAATLNLEVTGTIDGLPSGTYTDTLTFKATVSTGGVGAGHDGFEELPPFEW